MCYVAPSSPWPTELDEGERAFNLHDTHYDWELCAKASAVPASKVAGYQTSMHLPVCHRPPSHPFLVEALSPPKRHHKTFVVFFFVCFFFPFLCCWYYSTSQSPLFLSQDPLLVMNGMSLWFCRIRFLATWQLRQFSLSVDVIYWGEPSPFINDTSLSFCFSNALCCFQWALGNVEFLDHTQ